ncbi:Replication-associated recombination protein A [Natranaerofaba carboxydovora]|nr:replication-associated recombination protein A [Natranaerofaba carboxydovora]UMZ74012.1 Replication-associated recombination protein A [Natranaerofaba carboxydovora]
MFNYNYEKKSKKSSPLADRIRPKTLDYMVGQQEVVGEGRYLRRAIEEDRLFSMILYGPPGTGKTTLARIVANHTNSNFFQLNAVTSGIKEIREVINKAKEKKSYYQEDTILFIDEIHRFNKAQQDGLLPYVEDGTIILIGATTENPYFSINSPLLSRVRVFQLRLLFDNEIEKLIMRGLEDKENGLGDYNVKLHEDALRHLIRLANGDIRTALNALELSVITTIPDENNLREITLDKIEKSIQDRAVYYDKDGDNHYDIISAFIKSMRGSDPDASLYWLARMIEGGEDPLFITRRMLIFASEDIGNADPQALQVALSTHQAVSELGMPEARITLAQGVTYLSSTEKSNSSYVAIEKALKDVKQTRQEPVPLHLRDTHYRGAKNMGHGEGYKYPHNYPVNYVKQDYVPDNVKGKVYYEPSENGHESHFKNRLKYLRGEQNKHKSGGKDVK